MNVQQIQKLRDPEISLTEEVIESALETAFHAYQKFVFRLKQHEVQLLWRYYPDGKAWLAKGQYFWTGVRGGKKELTVFWLSIWNGFFKVTVYLPEKHRESVLKLSLDEQTKRMIEQAEVMGKTFKTLPLSFDVNSDEPLDSIVSLIKFKMDTK